MALESRSFRPFRPEVFGFSKPKAAPAKLALPEAWTKEMCLHGRQNVARRSVAADLADILASPEVSRLIDELQATRWTGCPGYPLRTMIGMALAKSLYALRRGGAPWHSSPSTRRSPP